MNPSSPIVRILAVLATAVIAGCAGVTEPVGAAAQASTPLAKQSIDLPTGITMKYLEAGNPAGEPVILLHGYTDSSRSWHPTMTRLVAERPDLHVFNLDQRGHGGSSMPADPACRNAPEQCFRPADFVADLLAFMDARGLDRATIVGHSMGSFVAQEIALTHPDRVDRIVLVGTAADLTQNAGLRDFILGAAVEGAWKDSLEAQGYTFPDDVYELTPLDADPDAEAWMAANWVYDPVAEPAFIADIVPETSRVRLGTWIGAARALAQIDNTERLKQLSVPAFVIWASQDSLFYESPDQTALLGSLATAADHCRATYWWKQYGKRPLPAEGVQIDDIGHNVQWGAPAAVADDLARYLHGGVPTRDWYFASVADVHRIDVDHGRAPVVHGPAPNCEP